MDRKMTPNEVANFEQDNENAHEAANAAFRQLEAESAKVADALAAIEVYKTALGFYAQRTNYPLPVGALASFPICRDLGDIARQALNVAPEVTN